LAARGRRADRARSRAPPRARSPDPAGGAGDVPPRTKGVAFGWAPARAPGLRQLTLGRGLGRSALAKGAATSLRRTPGRQCQRRDSNPHEETSADFESAASTDFATLAVGAQFVACLLGRAKPFAQRSVGDHAARYGRGRLFPGRPRKIDDVGVAERRARSE